MNKRVYLIISAVVLVLLICVGIILVVAHKPKNVTWEEAKDFLLKQLADLDYPDLEKMDVEIVDTNHDQQEIYNIIDKSGNISTDTGYAFTFRYNEKMPGLEERLADEFMVSADLSHIYWYDQANDYHIDINDKSGYDPSTGGW